MPALWWVELNLFPLKGRASSVGVFWGVCEFNTTLGSLPTDGWGCVPVLLVVWHEVSSTGAFRQLCGAWSLCWYGYLWEHACWLIFTGPGNSLVVQRPRLYIPNPEAQAWPLSREPRVHKLHSVAWEKRKGKKRKQVDEQNPRQIAKTTSKKQQQTTAQHTDTHTFRKKRKIK